MGEEVCVKKTLKSWKDTFVDHKHKLPKSPNTKKMNRKKEMRSSGITY